MQNNCMQIVYCADRFWCCLGTYSNFYYFQSIISCNEELEAVATATWSIRVQDLKMLLHCPSYLFLKS